jgi:hypothetical protein
MAELPENPDDNPFRAYSARNVLWRARERIQLIRHWLIRHEPEGSKNPPEVKADQKPGE